MRLRWKMLKRMVRSITLIASDVTLSSFIYGHTYNPCVCSAHVFNAGTCYSIAVSAPAATPVEEEMLLLEDNDDEDAYEEAVEPIASNGNGTSAPVSSVSEPEAAAMPEPTMDIADEEQQEDMVKANGNGAADFSLPDGVEAAEEDTQGWTLFKFRS